MTSTASAAAAAAALAGVSGVISGREIEKYTAAYEPVSLREPTKTEQRIDSAFTAFLATEIAIESDQEMARRDSILAEVRTIFQQWVKFVAHRLIHLPEEEAEDVSGALFISGSHRLGVRDVGADIDTVCVAPHFCTREHFFMYLKRDLARRPEVTELVAIEDAFVPLITFDYRGVSIDLLFARMADTTVPTEIDSILDDRILRDLDEATEKSLNGPRVTNMIFKLIGERAFPNFLIVLRCIRKWAKRRGLYGNKLGYLGGVNCNILVAFICQLFPNLGPAALLFQFFKRYRDWSWPEPVLLNNIQPNPPGLPASSERRVWNAAANPNDIMPIITPAYPAMNSAFNVSVHTFAVMQQEIRRGWEITDNILREKSWNDMESWRRLFDPSDFFLKYPHYLACHIIGSGENAASRSWMGFVESRIRRFTLMPFLPSLPLLTPIHLYPVVHKTQKSSNSLCYFIGFKIDVEALERRGDKNIHIDEVVYRFQESLWDPERGYRGEKDEGLDFFVEHLAWRKLPKEVFEPYGGFENAKTLRNQRILEEKAAKEAEEAAKAEALKAAEEEAVKVIEEKKVDPFQSPAGKDDDLLMSPGNRRRSVDDVIRDTITSYNLQKSGLPPVSDLRKRMCSAISGDGSDVYRHHKKMFRGTVPNLRLKHNEIETPSLFRDRPSGTVPNTNWQLLE